MSIPTLAAQLEAEPTSIVHIENEFLAMVSHELRTPLNAIVGFSEILAESEKLDDRQRRYAAHILTSGRKLTKLINDLLDLRRLKERRLDPRSAEIAAESLITATDRLFRPSAARKSIRLECRCEGPIPPLTQDNARLRQVLNQLVANAIQFTPEGGLVELSARAEGNDVVFAVSDTGPGIAEEEQKLVFEAFRQGGRSGVDGAVWTRPAGGLGLALARGLAERLGGSLALVSRVGAGSTFTLRIPCVYPARDGHSAGPCRRGGALRCRLRGSCTLAWPKANPSLGQRQRGGGPQVESVSTPGRDGRGDP
jgi:two-component system, NarL family, sensor histidine kinase BarA